MVLGLFVYLKTLPKPKDLFTILLIELFLILKVPTLSTIVTPFDSNPFTKRIARIAQNRNTKRLAIIIEFNVKNIFQTADIVNKKNNRKVPKIKNNAVIVIAKIISRNNLKLANEYEGDYQAMSNLFSKGH